MTFEDAVEHVLSYEGGYINDPKDFGGETNFGISRRAYPLVDIKNLTREGAIEIYRKDYWTRLSCDGLPNYLKLMVFDCAVNQGPGTARQILTNAPTKITRGPLLVWFANERLKRYFNLKGFATYGSGWTARVLTVLLSCGAEAMDD